jgi:hypothetical protein
MTIQAMPAHILKHFYYRRVYDNINRKNRNATFLFIGDVGRGKSWAALKFCSDLDPSFSVERVVFSVRDFLALLDKGDSHGSLKRGSAILFDEIAGSEDAAMSRDFMSKTNKIMSFISTVYRKRGYIVVYCAPFLHQIDKNVRMVGITGVLRFRGVKVAKKKSTADFYWCFPGFRTKDVLMPRPLVYDKELHSIKRVTAVNIDKPNQILIDLYEDKKEAFLSSQITKWHSNILGKEAKEQSGALDETDSMKITAKELAKQGLTAYKISDLLKKPTSTVQYWLRQSNHQETTLQASIPLSPLTLT